MKLRKQIERLKLVHKLIEAENTGSASDFANILGISRRQLYNIIEELKLMNAPIEYDLKRKTFLYTKECQIEFAFCVKILDEEETRNTSVKN